MRRTYTVAIKWLVMNTDNAAIFTMYLHNTIATKTSLIDIQVSYLSLSPRAPSMSTTHTAAVVRGLVREVPSV